MYASTPTSNRASIRSGRSLRCRRSARSEASSTLLLTKQENEATSRRHRSRGPDSRRRDGPRHHAGNLPGEHGGEQRAERPYPAPEPFPTDSRLRRRRQQLVLAKEAEQQQERAAADDHERYGRDVPCRRRPVGGCGAGGGEEDGSRAAQAAACGVFFNAGDSLLLHRN